MVGIMNWPLNLLLTLLSIPLGLRQFCYKIRHHSEAQTRNRKYAGVQEIIPEN